MVDALESHLQRQIEHSGRFFWHRLRWRAVREYVPEDQELQLVDVGAGAGLLGTFLARDRPKVQYRFVEPIDSLCQFLCGKYGVDANAAKDPDFREAQCVALLDVLEHQENDREFVAQLVAQMRPGSKLILTVPALQRFWSEWDLVLGHFRRYDRASLLRCLDGLPLAVLESSYLFPELIPLAILRAHRRRSGRKSDMSRDAEFPELPGIVNDILYGIGTLTVRFRPHWRIGTSLFVVAVVTES